MIPKSNIKFFNPIKATVIRKDGSTIDIPLAHNDIVLTGFQYLLGVAFRGVSQIGSWYMGLITSEGVTEPVLDETDTLLSKAWTETTDYSEANRPQWTAVEVDEQNISNSVSVEFTFNATAEIRGVFITSSNIKGGTAGTLWATALFAANLEFENTEKLKIVYSISAGVA